MTKKEKYFAAGAIVVAGLTATVICPALAPTIKIATIAGIGNALK